MADEARSIQYDSLIQQGYDYTRRELSELSWALRFTPAICMVGAIVGLITQQAPVHFTLAAIGILPFWFPSAHPIDLLYNHLIRPLWNGVRLPPNPLPRRIACFMGGTMNIGIGIAFLQDSVIAAYALGGILFVLQLIVITIHFCMASWMYEGLLKLFGRWTEPVSLERGRNLLETGGILVDVRNPDEFARGHLSGARNVPLDLLTRSVDEPKERCLLPYCQSGLRSQRATQLLKRMGYTNVHNFGGMPRWGEKQPN